MPAGLRSGEALPLRHALRRAPVPRGDVNVEVYERALCGNQFCFDQWRCKADA